MYSLKEVIKAFMLQSQNGDCPVTVIKDGGCVRNHSDCANCEADELIKIIMHNKYDTIIKRKKNYLDFDEVMRVIDETEEDVFAYTDEGAGISKYQLKQSLEKLRGKG